MNRLPTDLILYIKNFLDNKDIIKLLYLSKEYYIILSKKNNLWTSITFTNTSPLFVMINLFLKHKESIKKTTLIRLYDPHKIWPFETENMYHIDCTTHEDIVYTNIVKNIKIKFWRNKVYNVTIM
jgi:hypothetical protein